MLQADGHGLASACGRKRQGHRSGGARARGNRVARDEFDQMADAKIRDRCHGEALNRKWQATMPVSNGAVWVNPLA
jgi:hypothetical protein